MIRLTPKDIRAGYYNTSLIAYLTSNDNPETKGTYPTIVAFLDGKEVVVRETLKVLIPQFRRSI